MRLRRISDFIQALPVFKSGRVRDHRDAIEQMATQLHGRSIVVRWTQPRGIPLPAEVDHGRWIVRCPYCPGASMAEEGEVFFCPDCLMHDNDGLPRPVVFPPDAAAIEAVLLERPEEKNRNWLVYETVDALRRENDHHLRGSN